MIKNMILLASFVIIACSFAYANGGCIRNENGTTLLSAEGSTSPLQACDRTGRVLVQNVAVTQTPTVTPTNTPTATSTRTPTNTPTVTPTP